VPCETCVKRGCSAICPEGSLTTGKGNRLALADAEELHKKIERLRERCTKLEDALRTLQAAITDEPHPLLRDESTMDTTPSAGSSGSSPSGPLLTEEDEEILDAFGTLTLGIRGEARFFGQTSRSEAPTRTIPTTDSFPRLSPEIVAEAQIELTIPCRHPWLKEQIHALLPSLSHACRLCEIFVEYGQYIWYPIPRAELFDNILGSAYKTLPLAWLTIGLAVKMGHSVSPVMCADVNSNRWKLDPENGQKRARVFWQLLMQDTWLSFGFGRPPSMCLSFVDCPFPKDTEERMNAQGQKEGGFHPWTWQYTKLLNKIIFSVFGAKAPQYSSILEYDRMIRDFPVPINLRPNCGQHCGEPADLPISVFMQRFWTLTEKEATLLSLHRPWFAQALQEQPGDLLRHRYGPSVMAIYRSAWRIIEGAREAHKRASAVVSRLGLVWSQCLAAGIVMCLLVTRAPTSALAASSLQELDVLVEVFEKAAVTSQIASNNLEVVRKLRGQGYEVLHKPRTPGESSTNGLIDRELDRLGGRTHLISSMHESAMVCTLRNGSAASSGSSSSASAVCSDMIHPTIMQDLRVFEGIDAASWNGGASAPLDTNQFNYPDMPLQIQQPPVPGPDIFDELFGAQAFPPEPEQPVGPPVLDSTWQTFIEQLGF
ncbi:hypothetical protein DAEQUDRAFT_662513, partial [Daedalea quercina L-15889]